MEFFYPGGFAHDYECITRVLGMAHYGLWGDSYFTGAGAPSVAYPEGFQGNEIPIDGEVVANLVHRRLSLAEEADDWTLNFISKISGGVLGLVPHVVCNL